MQRLRVRVARVIDDQHRLAARGADPVVHGDQRATHGRGILAAQEREVFGADASHLFEHGGNPLCVSLRVAQGSVGRLTGVVPDHHGESIDLRRRGDREQQGGGRDQRFTKVHCVT